jgi:hypothetical protein
MADFHDRANRERKILAALIALKEIGPMRFALQAADV